MPRMQERVEEKSIARRAAYEILMEIAERKVVELVRDEEGEVCAVVENGGHREVWPVRGKEFDSLLNSWFYDAEGRGVREEVRKDVAATLEARGYQAPARDLHLFCSLRNDPPEIVLDLYTPDWTGVRIDAGGVSVVQLPPVFRRFRHLSAWEPEIPFQGEPREVIAEMYRRVCPCPEDERAYDLLVPAHPVMMLPIPRPIVAFLGGHGSGKSFAQRAIVRTYLRHGAVSAWGDHRDLVVTARQNPVLMFDNLTRVNEELARFLSVCVTGERVGTRELYTDKDAVYVSVKRAVFLNGIAPNIHSYPDLMDRTLPVKLERIPPAQKRPEGEIERELQPLYPKVFSASIEALRRAIPHLEAVREDLRGRLPRMADFAVWSEAVARGLGYGRMEWFRLYCRWVEETVVETLEASPLGRAILRLASTLRAAEGIQDMGWGDAVEEAMQAGSGIVFRLDGKPVWAGTPSALLTALRQELVRAGESVEEAERDGFPSTPNVLGRRLKEYMSSLLDMGVRITVNRIGERRTRIIAITVKTDETDNIPILYPLLPRGLNAYEGEGSTGGNNIAKSSVSSVSVPAPKSGADRMSIEDTTKIPTSLTEGEKGAEMSSVSSVSPVEKTLTSVTSLTPTLPVVVQAEVPRIVGADGRSYGPFVPGDRAELPLLTAEVLIRSGMARLGDLSQADAVRAVLAMVEGEAAEADVVARAQAVGIPPSTAAWVVEEGKRRGWLYSPRPGWVARVD